MNGYNTRKYVIARVPWETKKIELSALTCSDKDTRIQTNEDVCVCVFSCALVSSEGIRDA